MIDIALLGRVSVTVETVPIAGDVAHRRRLALLALLAAPSLRPLGRDRLIACLWPESDADSARRQLAAAVHVLHGALGVEALLTPGDEIALNPALVRSDVPAFRDAVHAGDWQRALELYQGEFLSGFFISGSAEFEHWAEGERAELARLYGQALEGEASLRAVAGDAEGAIAAWRHRAALDPCDARVASRLMEALAAGGQRAAAIQHARVHAQLLAQEFGASPDAEVQALAERLRHSSGLADVPAETRPARPSAAALPRSEAPPPVAPAPARRHTRFRSGRWIAPLLLIVASAVYWSATRTPDTIILVRPFEPDSLGRGLAAEVLDELGRIRGVSVVSRELAFATVGPDPRVAAARVGADVVLSGTLHGQPGAWRFDVELAGSTGLDIVGGEVVAPTLQGLKHALLEHIARELGRSLREESASGAAADAADPAAVKLYLLGRTEWLKGTPASLRRSQYYFEQAIGLDPRYASAWVGLADALNMLGSYDYAAMPPDSAYPRARQAALRAIDLDDELGDAYAALGNVQANYLREWDEAEYSYRKAIRRNPGSTAARQWYALLLAARRKFRSAAQQSATAAEQEPGAPAVLLDQARVYYYARDYDQARASLARAFAIDSGYHRAHVLRALVDLVAGRDASALAQLSAIRAASGSEPEPMVIALLGCAQARNGAPSAAREQLGWLQHASQQRYVPAELPAMVQVALGDYRGALTNLQRAFDARSPGMVYLDVEPLLDPVRNLPEFRRLRRSLP